MNIGASGLSGYILVIDDNLVVRHVLARTLARAGYAVTTAENGRDAMTLFDRLRPALIITDLFMPEADGFDTIRGLRGICRDLPIIAISGALHGDDVDFLNLARLLGATEILQKPFAAAELLPIVAKCLERPRGDAADARDAGEPPAPPIAFQFVGAEDRPEKRQRMAGRLAALFADANRGHGQTAITRPNDRTH